MFPKRKILNKWIDEKLQIEVFNNKAFSAYDNSQFETALTLFQVALDIQKNAYSLFGMGLCLIEKYKYKQALQIFEKLANLAEREYINAGLFYQAHINHLMGAYKEAREFFKTFIKINEKLTESNKIDAFYPQALEQLGATYHFEGNYEKAMDYYKKASDFYVKLGMELNVFDSQAATYYRQEKFQQAEEMVNKSLEKNPKNKWTYRYKGYLALLVNKNIEEAELFFNKTTDECNLQSRIDSLYFKGLIAFLKGQKDVAINLFEEARKQYDVSLPDNITDHCGILYHIGKILVSFNYLNEAERFFKDALSIKKDYYGVIQELEKLQHKKYQAKWSVSETTGSTLETEKTVKENYDKKDEADTELSKNILAKF